MQLKILTSSLVGVATLFGVSCSDPAPVSPVPIKPGPARAGGAGQVSPDQPSPSRAQAAATVSPPVSDQKARPGQITGVDMGRLFTLIQTGRVMLVDCRPALFFHRGHIEGAINLPHKKYDALIRDRKAQLDRALAADQVIVLYCQNSECPDAYGVAKKLSILGYPVSVYQGGWEEWKRAGL